MPKSQQGRLPTAATPATTSPAAISSEVSWTLRRDRTTYETLLMLIFEDPVPLSGDGLDGRGESKWVT